MLVSDSSVVRFSNPENGRLFLIAATGALVITGMFALALLPTLPLLAPLPAAVGAGLWHMLDRCFRKAHLEARDDGVLVKNPFSEVWIGWADVVDIDGGRFLRIRRSNGSDVTVWAVQNSNAAAFSRRNGYADEVAATLLILKRAHG